MVRKKYTEEQIIAVLRDGEAGAEVIVTVTNWVKGNEFASEHMVLARACENHVYFVAVSRVGEERGIKFLGRSKFVNCQ